MSMLLEAEEKLAQEPVAPLQQSKTDSSPLPNSNDDGNESYDILYAQDSWDDAVSDEEPGVSTDDLILHLAAAADPTTSINCLEQLTHTYRSIVGCDAWHQLLQLLPQHLTATPAPICSTKHHSNPAADSAAHSSQLQDSSADSVVTAAEQLLLQKLAPEVLDCSPEPLAELLLALLTATRSNQHCRVGSVASAASPDPHEALAPQEAAAKVQTLPPGHTQHHLTHSSNVAGSISPSCMGPIATRTYTCLSSRTVQLIVVGLHKIARQWHFLDERISQQLSDAVVGLLLEPLQLLLTLLTSNSRDARQSQLCPHQQTQTANANSQLPQESVPTGQLQQHMQCQALGAVEYPGRRHEQQEHEQQPMCSFTCCLAEKLVIADPAMCWLHRMNACSTSGRMLRKAMISSGLVEQLTQWIEGFPCSEEGQSSFVPAEKGLMNLSSMQVGRPSQQQMQHCLCVAYQLLSTLMETPAGRRLLAASQCGRAKSSARQQYHSATAHESCRTAGHPTNTPDNSRTAVHKVRELGKTSLSAAVASLSWLARQAVPKDCRDAALLAAAESAILAIDALLQAPGERGCLVLNVPNIQ